MPLSGNPRLSYLRQTDPAKLYAELVTVLLRVIEKTPHANPINVTCKHFKIWRTTLFRWLDETGDQAKEGSIEFQIYAQTQVTLRPGTGRPRRPEKITTLSDVDASKENTGVSDDERFNRLLAPNAGKGASCP